MKNLARTSPLIVSLFLSACGGESLSTSSLAPQLAVGGNSGCYTVKYNVMAQPSGPLAFSGSFSGDIQGTVSFSFDAASFKFAGATFHNSGTATWHITGGIIPAPLTFTTSFDNLNLLTVRPGSPGTLFENIETHRAVSGVSTANLHYQGTFTQVPSQLVDHDFQGVICP